LAVLARGDQLGFPCVSKVRLAVGYSAHRIKQQSVRLKDWEGYGFYLSRLADRVWRRGALRLVIVAGQESNHGREEQDDQDKPR
jgi:hypothetical protein